LVRRTWPVVPFLAARGSGSSPAAILEQETKELHHDRERVEEMEADATLRSKI
jgi:hypothetical protein